MSATVCRECGSVKSELGGPLCWCCKGNCRHTGRQPVAIYKRNGTAEVKLRCDHCEDLEGGHRARDYDLTTLPVHADHRGSGPTCQRCGQGETELHHFAPVGLFGWDEAERWPKAWLCRACHVYWHQVMRSGPSPSAPPS